MPLDRKEGFERAFREVCPERRHRHLAALLTAALLAAVIPFSIPDRANGLLPRSGAVASGAARSGALIGDRIAAGHTSRQMRSGAFPDYVVRFAPGRYRNRYGPAVMGGALVLNGVRSGRPGPVRAGLRSIRLALLKREGIERSDRRGRGRKSFEYPFSVLGIVESWRALRTSAGKRVRKRLARPDRRTVALMGRELARLAPIPSRADRKRWSEGQNRVLLERLVWLEALSTGIRPKARTRGAVLRRPAFRRSQTGDFLRRWLAERPRGMPGGDPTGPLLLASDSPRWPLAYHALSAALLARALPFTTGSLRTTLGIALRDAVRATRFLITPDGDLAYAGRSTMQAWSLSMAAYAALATSRVAGVLPAELAANRELARLLIERLSEAYMRRDGRLMINPGLNPTPEAGALVLDRYASEVPYAGLTLLGLEWAAAESDGPGEPLPDATRHAWADRGSAAFVTARTGNLWFALRAFSPDSGDRRLDLGPIAAKQFSGERWDWLIPPRPPGAGRGPDSWIGLRSGERRFAPLSARLHRRGTSWVHEIGFGSPGAGVEEEVALTYRPAGCGGLEIEIGAIGSRAEVGFWIPGDQISIESDRAGGAGILLSVSRPVEIGALPTTPGPAHPRLSPVSIAVGPHAESTTITLCRTA